MLSRFWRTSQAVLVWYSAFLLSSQLPWNSIYRMFFIHFPSNQFKLEQKYWIDCEEMCLLHSIIKYGNLVWPFIWGSFSLIPYCRILIWEQVSWFYFPFIGVRKPLCLIIKEKILVSEKKIFWSLWSMSSQCCLSMAVLQSSYPRLLLCPNWSMASSSDMHKLRMNPITWLNKGWWAYIWKEV